MSKIKEIIDQAQRFNNQGYCLEDNQKTIMFLTALDVLVNELAKITRQLGDIERAICYEPGAKEDNRDG